MKHEPTIHGYTLDSFEKEKQQYLNHIPFSQEHARHVEYLDEQIQTIKRCVLSCRNLHTSELCIFSLSNYLLLSNSSGFISWGESEYIIIAVTKLKSIV